MRMVDSLNLQLINAFNGIYANQTNGNDNTNTPSTGAKSIIDAINKMTQSGWDILKAIAGGIAVVAFVWVFIGMIFSSDAQSVAKSKKQLLVIGIALLATQFADKLVVWITQIASTITLTA